MFFPDLGLISFGRDGKERWHLPLGPFDTWAGSRFGSQMTGEAYPSKMISVRSARQRTRPVVAWTATRKALLRVSQFSRTVSPAKMGEAPRP